MIVSDAAIVLKAIKYGDTSLICQMLTRDFGLISFIFKGVRSQKKKQKHAGILFPGAILDIQYEKHPQRNLQYPKSYQLQTNSIFAEETVVKNCIRMFAVEILGNLVMEEQEQHDLFLFYQNFIQAIYQSKDSTLGNVALYFLIQSAKIAGYAADYQVDFSSQAYFSIASGAFQAGPDGLTFLEPNENRALFELLQTDSLEEACSIVINNISRRNIMQSYIAFLQYHTAGFKEIKSLSVLQTILS